MDAVTEEEILAGLRERLSGSTVIWVAHRMSTLKLCDRVYQLDAGVLSPVDLANAADQNGLRPGEPP